MPVVIGTLAYVLLGVACVAVGVKTRKGWGTYSVSRREKVRYDELPVRERVRTGNALIALGAVLLPCSAFSVLPEVAVVVFFLAAVALFVRYAVVQKGLRRAALRIARAAE